MMIPRKNGANRSDSRAEYPADIRPPAATLLGALLLALLPQPSGAGYEEWTIANQLPPERAAPHQDGIGSGIPNLLRYALGPAGQSALPQTDEDTGQTFFGLTIDRNPQAWDVDFHIEVSDNLVDWRRNDEQIAIITDHVSALTVRDLQPMNQLQTRFMRLAVELIDREDQILFESDGASYIRSVGWSPNGRSLYTGERTSNLLKKWDAVTGAFLWQASNHSGQVLDLATSKQGVVVAASGAGVHNLTVYDEAGDLVRRMIGHHDNVTNIALSPDDRLAVSTDRSGSVIIWRMEDGSIFSTLDGGQKHGVYNPVAWSPDNDFFALAHRSPGGDYSIQIRDWRRLTLIDNLPAPSLIRDLAWSPNGEFLAAVDGNGEITVRPTSNLSEPRRIKPAHGPGHGMVALAWSPDSRFLATAGADDRIRVWTLHAGGNHIYQAQAIQVPSQLESLAWSPCGGFLAAGAREQQTFGLIGILKMPPLLRQLGPAADLPPAHPFHPRPQLTLVTERDMHRSRGSGLVILEDRWLFFWREGDIHNAIDPASVVKMAESCDGGRTLENVRTIYVEADGMTGTDIRARLMGNGRIGLFGSRRDADDNGRVHHAFFMYSDDGGLTWISQVLDHLPIMSPSFTFSEFPASVGGHDSDGYILFCHGGGSIHAAYTVDNGATWQSQALFPSSFAWGSAGEVSVVRLGESDRWIMTSRSTGENPIYKSTDLFNWEGPFRTGKFIGNNPSASVYHDGHITWIAASRPYHYEDDSERAIPVNGQIFKGLVTTTLSAESLWRNPGRSWPDWEVLAYLPVHFDGTFVSHNGSWHMLFGAIEGPMEIGRKRYSQLGVMSATGD